MYDGVRDGFTCRAQRVPVRRVYRRVTRCGFGQQQMDAFIQQPHAFINQQSPFIMQQQGGAFPQQQLGFDPGAFRAAETEEAFSDDQRAAEADSADNTAENESRSSPENESRTMIFDGSGRPLSFNSRPAGMWCRVIRVPSRQTYRKTITCGRR
jgi:hypothetical protein